MKIFGPKCPKCGGHDINTVTESFAARCKRLVIYVLFFITLLFVKAPKPLYVCRDCGFSWEKR